MKELFSDIKKEVSSNETIQEGAAIAGLLFILGTIGISIVSEIINKKINKSNKDKIKQEVDNYANKYKEAKEFKNKISDIREISIDELANKGVLEDKDAKLCKHNDMVAYAIFDKNDFILAYALFSFTMSSDVINGYAFRICDKSIRHTPELAFFIKATFELNIMYYGPGLRKILSGKLRNVYSDDLGYTDIVDKDGRTNSKPLSISKEEFYNIVDSMEAIINKIARGMGDIYPKYKKIYNKTITRVNGADTFKKPFKQYYDIKPYMYAYMDLDIDRSLDYKAINDLFARSVKDICGYIKKEGFDITLEPGTDSYWMSGAVTRTKSSIDYPYFTILVYLSDGHLIVYIASNRTFRLE